jgi:hypothetical protein
MVMTAETCVGPRAYGGLVSSYYETTTTDFKRLQDENGSNKSRRPLPPTFAG